MNDDRLPIAGVHATVLSIFVAIFSSLGLYYHASGEQQRSDTVQEANKAGDIGNMWTYIYVGSSEICDSHRRRGWSDNHQEIVNTCKGSSNPKDNGESLFCSFYSVLSGYPYVVQDELLRRAGRIHRFKFQSYEQVVRWAEDYTSVSRTLSACKDSLTPTLERYLATVSWRNQGSDYLKLLYSVTSDLDIFLARLQQRISQISATPFTRYGGRYVLPVFLFLSLVAFVSGVIMPIVWKGVTRLFLIWIPVAYYFILFISLVAAFV